MSGEMLQNPRQRAAIFTVVLAFSLLWVFATRVESAQNSNNTATASPQKGFTAPDFSLETTSGETVTLSNLRGQVVVLNFWASWCGPCRLEMPALERVYQSFHELDLEVLAVNTADQDSLSAAQDFITEHGLTFPVPLDSLGTAAAAYNVYGLPSTYFIDQEGVIQDVVVGGPMSEALIQSKVEALLAGAR